jgi:hypothetical protein
VYSKMHIKILDETPFQSCPAGTCVHRSLQWSLTAVNPTMCLVLCHHLFCIKEFLFNLMSPGKCHISVRVWSRDKNNMVIWLRKEWYKEFL